MKDLPLNALRAFALIFDHRGVRPAARALGVTHSTVSRHLRELEAWIGAPLVDERRNKGTIVFTAQGKALGETASAALHGLATAVQGIRERHRPNSVVIATTPSIASLWLLPRLSDLNDRFGWVEVSVLAEQRLAFGTEHGADIGIRMGKGPWPEFDCAPLMDDELVPVASPVYLRSLGTGEGVARLAKAVLLHDRDPNAAWSVWADAHRVTGLDLSRGPRFASSDLVIRAAAQGLGVGLVQARLAEADLAAGNLVPVAGGMTASIGNAYWLLQPKGAPVRKAVSTVIDWLREQAAAGARIS